MASSRALGWGWTAPVCSCPTSLPLASWGTSEVRLDPGSPSPFLKKNTEQLRVYRDLILNMTSRSLE